MALFVSVARILLRRGSPCRFLPNGGYGGRKKTAPSWEPVVIYGILCLHRVLFGGAYALDVAFVFVKSGAENVAAGVVGHKIQIIKIGRGLQHP